MLLEPDSPAFPVDPKFFGDGDTLDPYHEGLSKYEYVVIRMAAAIISACGDSSGRVDFDAERVVKNAVKMADAMVDYT